MRTSPATGPLRIARSGLLVVVAFALASLSHVAAGGRLPSIWLLLPMLVPVFCVAYLLTGRLVGTRTAALVMGSLQLLLHQAFSLFGGHGHVSSGAPLTSGSGHLHATSLPGTGPFPTSGVLSSLTPVDLGPSALGPHPGFSSLAALGMLVLHLFATALSVLALTALERGLWQVWAWLSPMVSLLGTPAQFPQHRLVSRVEIALRGPVLRRVGRRRKRRGPPLHARTLVPA